MLRAVQVRVRPGNGDHQGVSLGHRQGWRERWAQWALLKLVGRLCVLAGRAGGLARRPTSEAVLPPVPGGLGAGRAALPPSVSRSHPADGGEAGE